MYLSYFRRFVEPYLRGAKICSASGTNVFNGTDLADCSFMAPQIKACQNNGKIVTLSLGGATAVPGFSSNSQARAFADQIWALFLGGSSPTRPFGSAVLDGYVPCVCFCHPFLDIIMREPGSILISSRDRQCSTPRS